MIDDETESFDPLLAAIAHAPAVALVAERSRLGPFELGRRLGQGGFGSVFEARDSRDGQRVALKLLRWDRTEWLARFKREFRMLADTAHENLVRLDELCSDGDAWFFTMELVDGEPFLDFVRRHPDTLRESFAQLVRGLSALHASGRVHRDVKPSNVLVEPSGRVVILDFGLAVDLSADDPGGVAGTPKYMAPEQSTVGALGPAADLYAVGVMLFEALTHGDPFTGGTAELLAAKRAGPPPGPWSLAPDAPEELRQLAVRLLAPDPERRPPAPEVLEALSSRADEPPSPSRERRQPEAFVGRHAELSVLAAALAGVRAGAPSLTLLSGSSGMGKSTLLERFVDDVRRADPSAVVLSGRCFAQESVPYKALDSVVDQLARFLGSLPRAEVRSVLPRHAGSLAQVFPVLRQLDDVRDARARAPEDQGEARRRAMGALRELFQRLSSQRTVVVSVDDLQWGDADSAALLGELMRPPDPPVVLFVGAYRTEEADTSPLLTGLSGLRKSVLASVDVRELEVGALDAEATRELAVGLVPPREADDVWVRQVADEARGCPFLIHELAREGTAGPPRAQGVVLSRVSALPDGARAVLETIAVAGRPLELAALRVAAGAVDLRSHLALLKAERLVRPRELGQGAAVEAYHDRIREAVTRDLAPSRATRLHRALAGALEQLGADEPERLAGHLAEAGEPARAARLLHDAARRAGSALAFDHAANLLRRVALLRAMAGGDEPDARRALSRELGDALAAAGRGSEAADAYLSAARGASTELSFELRRQAGEQLFLVGHMERGREVLSELFESSGLRLPASGALAAIVHVPRRLRLSLRGYGFTERASSTLSADERRRLDLLSVAALGFFATEPPSASGVVAELARRALDSGVPERVVDALVLDVGSQVLLGGDWRAPREALGRIATTTETEQARIACVLADAMVASFQSRWSDALSLVDEADAMMAGQARRPAVWTRVRFLRFDALFWMGRIREAARCLPPLLQEVRERGNLFGQVWMSLIWSWVVLAHGGPAESQEVIDHALRSWGAGGTLPRWWRIPNDLAVALYVGDVDRAARAMSQSPFKLYHLPLIGRDGRAQLHWGHARVALATAADRRRDRALQLRVAERELDAMARTGASWAPAVEPAMRASLCHLRGDDDRALALLEVAEPRAAAVGMDQILAVIRAFRGSLVGGERGAGLLAEANAWARDAELADFGRFATVYVPGAPIAR